MKKLALVVTLITLWGALVAAQTGAPPDTAALDATMSAAQAAYHARTGHYLQLQAPYPTLAPPRLRALIFNDRQAAPHRPSPLPTPIPEFSWFTQPGVVVNVYTGPLGDGFEIVYILNGWRRIAVAGPETWRAQDWQPLSPLPTPVSPLPTPEAP